MKLFHSLGWRRVLVLVVAPIALLLYLRSIRYDQRRTLKGVGSVMDLSFVDNGKKLAVISGLGSFSLWDVSSRTRLKLRSSSGGMFDVTPSFYRGGKAFLWFGADEETELWNADNLERQKVIPWKGKLRGERILPNGSKTYVGPTVGDLSEGRISPDGKRLVIATHLFNEQANILWCWDVEKQILLWRRELNPQAKDGADGWSRVTALAFSPDNQVISANTADGRMVVLDMKRGSLKFTLKSSKATAVMDFSSTKSFLAAGGAAFEVESYPSRILVWDVSAGKLLLTIDVQANISSLRFAPNRRDLAVGLATGAIHLYAVPSGRFLRTFKSHRRRVKALDFSPDGKLLASGSEDGTVKLWDLS